jgi:hypothetical protein
MSNYDYQVLDDYPKDKKLKFEVSHHRHHITESLESMSKLMERIQEQSLNNDIYGAVRSIEEMRDLSQTLFNACDHLLMSTQNLTTPNRGGD